MVLDAPNAVGHSSGAVRGRLRSGPGTLLDVSWPLLARPGRLKIGLWAAFGRPQTVPSASRRVPETASSAQNRPRAIFQRFFDDLARFFVDFRSIFDRFCIDFSPSVRTFWALCLLLLSASFLCSCALLTFARSLSTVDRLNAKIKKRAGFASLLRLAARACPHDFHNPLHDLRANALHVRSSKPHLVHTYILLDIHVPGAGAFGHFGALGGLGRALFASIGPHAQAKKKRRASRSIFAFCRAIRAARARFWVARTVPGSILEAENPRFSRFHVARARSLLTSCESNKTL